MDSNANDERCGLAGGQGRTAGECCDDAVVLISAVIGAAGLLIGGLLAWAVRYLP